MTIKVIEAPLDTRAVKRKLCMNCGATLEYTRADTTERMVRDYTGCGEMFRFIKCPKCKYEIQMKINLIDESNDCWAKIELYRWQHGEMPQSGENKQLDVPTAMLKMAEALSGPDQSKWPLPFNVASVLAYAAKQLKDKSSN